MIDAVTIAKAAEIARALEQPARAAELNRHHKALIEALNGSHTNGSQDALCVLEAIALTLAQVVGGIEDSEREGFITYVAARASYAAPMFRTAGAVARHRVERDS